MGALKDWCIRCDARPALPGRLYCSSCLPVYEATFDLAHSVQRDRSQHQAQEPEEHTKPTPD